MLGTTELLPLCGSSSAFTSVDGRFQGGWQVDAVVDPLSVTNPPTLAALKPLLNQEAEDIARVLGAGTVPLNKRAQEWEEKGSVKSGAVMRFKYKTPTPDVRKT